MINVGQKQAIKTCQSTKTCVQHADGMTINVCDIEAIWPVTFLAWQCL